MSNMSCLDTSHAATINSVPRLHNPLHVVVAKLAVDLVVVTQDVEFQGGADVGALAFLHVLNADRAGLAVVRLAGVPLP
mgnify:CR=1 FL=1